ncbi:uncharacterized protein LOC117181844 [Belonocnema kinseyi]|uniref:uncharacterized protein LOC117181844 n=1 Tax=Belonocnema kinseyi TaxID=2817044 RepID=UPI00143D3F51|nr:uncharacterized protein LOC117181844 [Belonocnema kinseyi]
MLKDTTSCEPSVDPVMSKQLPNHPAKPILETPMISREPPPYQLDLSKGALQISKMDPPYLTSTDLSTSHYPMPQPEPIEAGNKDVKESILGIKSALSSLDEEASHLFDLPTSTQTEASEMDSSAAPSNAKLSSSDSGEVILLTLEQIKLELSEKITSEKLIMLSETLRAVSERIRSDVPKMTPEERKTVSHKLLSVKTAYMGALEKNQNAPYETSHRRQSHHRRHSHHRNSETRSSIHKNESSIVEVEETKSCRINVPVTFKLLEMILNTSYLFCIAKLSPNLPNTYIAYSEVISIIGFCISLTLLWIYLRNIRNGFKKKYLKFDLIYCTLMTVCYILATILIALRLNFVWRNFFLASEVSGIITVVAYFYDACHNCQYRLSGTNGHDVH